MEKGDCSHLLEGKDPSRILKKALALLEHQVTKDDVNRQLTIIDQYFVVTKDGFMVRDLCNVMYFFELVRQKLLTEPAFEEPMNKLLDLCSVPPILTRSMEILGFAMDIEEYFSWLGYMIVWTTEKKHLMKIINAIHALLTHESPKKYYLSLAVRKEKACASRLAELLGDLLEIAEDDIYLMILKVVKVLIDESKQTCIRLLSKDVVTTIIGRLEPTWRQRIPSRKPKLPLGNEEILLPETIFHILTILLSHANPKNMRAPSKFALWSLQWAFRLFTIKETTNVERNNVLAVLLLLLDIYPDLLLGNLTFAYDIAMLAMSKDIVFHPNWITDIKLTTSHEDHSFMALLLMCISYFPNFLSGPKVIEECRVVIGLMKLISHQQAIKWHQLQLCYLVRLSLNILLKIVPASPEEFIEDGGPLTILQRINHAMENKEYYNYETVFRSVELLAQLSYKFKSIRESVAFNGGVKYILNLCKDVLAPKYILEQNQILLGIGFCLLEQICTFNDAYQVLPLIVSYMERYVNPDPKEQIQMPKLIVMCLSFIWTKVVPSKYNCKEFLRVGGVYLMLDIIQVYPSSEEMLKKWTPFIETFETLVQKNSYLDDTLKFYYLFDCLDRHSSSIRPSPLKRGSTKYAALCKPCNKNPISLLSCLSIILQELPHCVEISCLPVKMVALGALIDLCEEVECIPYLITWRKKGQGIKALLMEIFRQENRQLVVKSDEHGIILDHHYPLMGEDQYYETYCMCEKHSGNACIGDMFISCRPKVYCLLQILNHKQYETVQIANEFYKVYSEELSVQDEVTHILAENFLALKLGEAWKEIKQEFKKMVLEPIPSDERTLKAMCRISDKWGSDLQKTQRQILKKYRLTQQKKEHTLYNTLREARLAEAWESLCEMKYIARCSERLFRVTSNFNLQSQISNSLRVDDVNGQLHRTFQSNISVTCMRNQSICIPNEAYEETVNAKKPIIISPISSVTNTPRDDKELQGEYLPEEESNPCFKTGFDQSVNRKSSFTCDISDLPKIV